MKVVLAGSPQIAVEAFEKVIQAFDVVAVVTQPDRPKGRGLQMIETDVSQLAKKHNLNLYKPEKISEIYEELKQLDFDILLTFAYGQFIPTKILELGKYKPMNIHGSLLPKYRGAAPIHYAILNGDSEIGISLIEMTKEMDAGDVYFKDQMPINEETTTGDAFKIISDIASKNIVDWLKKIEENDFTKTVQGSDFTLSPKIEKSYAELKNDLTIEEAKRKVKGLNPFPGAFMIVDGKRLKIFNVSKENKHSSIQVNFKDGRLYATDYQWEGKRRVVLN